MSLGSRRLQVHVFKKKNIIFFRCSYLYEKIILLLMFSIKYIDNTMYFMENMFQLFLISLHLPFVSFHSKHAGSFASC